MTNLIMRLENLRRPSLMIRAARAGAILFDRHRDLMRLGLSTCLSDPSECIGVLLRKEAELETARKLRSPSYELTRHIQVLIALIAEARLLSCTDKQKEKGAG